ncbi:MAG: FUSC family protein [Actinomycetes bacterium]
MDRASEGALDRLRELSRAEDPWASLGPRALLRTGRSARSRLRRLSSRSWLIAQCAVAAAAAWLLAQVLLGHPRPFFAPVVAMVGLGISYGNKLRRVGEILVGVAVGVGIGDLFVRYAGTGVWQIAVVVAVSMGAAVLLDAGALIVTQAGVQAVIVTTLLPTSSAGLERWLDALVGGGVALATAAVVPRTPLVRPRVMAADVLAGLGELLEEAARSAKDGDVQRASRALERARRSGPVLEGLREAANEALAVARGSPFRWRHRRPLEDLAAFVEPLDRAVRNVRVLLRRVTVASWREESVPDSLIRLITQLGAASHVLSDDLAEERREPLARKGLRDVARESSTVPVGVSLSSDVVLAQIRSITVDLLQVSGIPYDEALQLVPPARRTERT